MCCMRATPLESNVVTLCATKHIYTGLSRFPDKRVDRQRESRAKASYSFSEPHSLLSVRRRRVLINAFWSERRSHAVVGKKSKVTRLRETHHSLPYHEHGNTLDEKLILAQAYRGAKRDGVELNHS